MGKINDNVKEFALIAFTLLGILFGMMLMTFIFGQLGNSAVTSIDNSVTGVTNETVLLADATGIGSISGATNSNFVTWNATLVLNATLQSGSTSDETLVEGADYTIFANNGTFQNITGDWNRSLVTYSVTRKTEAKESVEATQNNSLTSIVIYTNQSDTQFRTVAIAITLVILIAVFLLFWRIFISQKKKKGDKESGNFM
ncbi:hypothetical protein LCGC14_0924690 [marine sediment metagenome]|uniref:Uncharacterized protein n=1 Tax=marine sediment metagenome TaxID=412755 RepID=A0A0F9NUJ0_9ZZZZ